MSARVLVVDDIPANVKLLEARLTAEYFEVVTAMTGPEALLVCEKTMPDIILLDVMMPGMDGFEVCRRLKASGRTAHIPVVMVTALDDVSDRIRGLEAGADDFLTKPVSDVALVTRVRSLTRLKMMTDDLHHRYKSSHSAGADGPELSPEAVAGTAPGRVLIVDDRRSSYEQLAGLLRSTCDIEIEADPQEALIRVAEGNFELALINLGLASFDALRLCAQIRSLDRTRMLPILLIIDEHDAGRLSRALEIGVNDYITQPLDKLELRARVRTQIRRKRFTDYLRRNVQNTMEMAVTDGLTGLHNRRYMESHMQSLLDQSMARGRSLAIQVLDIDFFKSINDTYGHDAGDEVLKEFADRVRANVRGIDLVCRMGGEEFVVVMPDTEPAIAEIVAERVRRCIADDPFAIAGGRQAIDVTVSIGIGTLALPADTAETILKRADTALYRAKKSGRNRVVCEAA